MTAHHNRLKVASIKFANTDYACQVTSWVIENNTDDGDKVFTYCADGEFRDEADDDYSLSLKWVSDWTESGLNRYMVANDGTTVAFTIENHTDIDGETAQWAGTVKIKAPNAGGDVRTLETSEVTLPIIGKPTVTYPVES